MMDRFRFTFLLVLSIFVCSCEKVIDLKLKNIEPKYVIEGIVTNETGKCRVMISTTQDFTDSNDFKGIGGASVNIESKGISYVMKETSAGLYQNTVFKGIQGQTYQLTVRIAEKTFTATSTMPVAGVFQDMYVANGDFDAKKTLVSVRYEDAPDAKNYYWFQRYVNGVEQKDNAIITDEFLVGHEIIAALTFENTSNDSAKDFKKGDRLVVEMHTIAAPMYTYLHSLYGANGADNGTAPANPESNLIGGALGYFSAHTTQRKVLVLP